MVELQDGHRITEHGEQKFESFKRIVFKLLAIKDSNKPDKDIQKILKSKRFPTYKDSDEFTGREKEVGLVFGRRNS